MKVFLGFFYVEWSQIFRKEIRMFSTKRLAVLLLVLAVLFGQVGNVAAAPQPQDTTLLTGTIQSIATETDANGVTTVLVTVLDAAGETQTVRLSVETAMALGLVTLDPLTQEPVIDESQIGQTVEIDPATVIPEEEPVEEDVHPIAWLLAEFFGEDPSVVEGYHEDGFGFGVIAQALWMSETIGGDASAAGLILQAKETGDFSAFTLEDGTIPSNWGQFKKAVLGKEKKNLGVIVSGHAEEDSLEGSTPQGQGNGHGKDKEKNKEKGRGRDNNRNRP
jgi:hypothetical protein